ncbi:hypothetical protein SI65_08289 [Aspergillus cristatus]|uniref:Uncharacterized protein n=1 Tax=Aspergillus cristatus TaxID=573508 RepID=A0A1E3B5P8_ASPCR|nr:hypothetical protein SI65_08289 [Aspergillus cristatus]
MTTAPSIAFPTMEVPAADDTMEMASPLPGHADDFDIDLDVMEYQASNADKDMMGADDYPDESIEIEYTRDGANDADMIDDVAEPTMVDADDQYPETNDNVEMQYSADETYEAEMLEDDYDEDIDVPMPKSDEQGPTTAHDDIGQKPELEIEPSQTNDVVQEESEKHALETHVESTEEHVTEPAEAPHTEQEQHGHPGSEHVQEAGLQPEKSEGDKIPETNQTERADVQSVQPDLNKDGPTDSKQPEEGAGEVTEAQPPIDQSKEQEVEPTEVQDTEKPKEKEQGADSNEHAALHPVKVYYQDNEVSLFPPREGDSSETFFLEDESLAYENFGKLFESFREVLREHIGENDVLVVDIDALNIQLTEDSLNSSKVTLRQIINVYLHLCDNESIGEPESLYITLSTKLTASAAISELAAAANEGKGLSEIFSWDEFDEVEPISAGPDAEPQHDLEFQEQAPEESQKPPKPREHEEREEPAEHVTDPEPVREEPEAPEEQEKPEASDERQVEAAEATQVPEQDAAEHEEGHNHELQPEVTNEAEPAIQEGAHLEQEDQEQDDDKLASNQPGEEVEDAALTGKGEDDEYGEINEGEYEEDAQEYHDPELENQDHPSNDRSYDSEEQKTESTATIAPLPVTDRQQDVELSADVTEADGDHGEYDEVEDTGEEDHPNDHTNLDAPEHDEYSEEQGYNNVDGAYDEQNAKEPREEPLSKTHDTSDGDEDEDRTPQEDLADEAFQGNEDAVHSHSEDGDSDPAQNDARTTPEPADELLGIAESVMDSPSKNAKDNDETADSGEVLDDDAEYVSSATAEEGVNEVTFDGDDDEFFNLDFDDEAGPETNVSDAVPDHNVSTKRTRDPEDETDLTETTPDAKRSRSS